MLIHRMADYILVELNITNSRGHWQAFAKFSIHAHVVDIEPHSHVLFLDVAV